MIPHTEKYKCYRCGIYGNTQLHHIVPGSRRQQSDKDGLTVYLCPSCHRFVHSAKGRKDMLALKRIAQAYYEERRIAEGYTAEEARTMFIKNYIKSYL